MLILRGQNNVPLRFDEFFPNFFLDMDVFWAECYEMTKVLAQKHTRVTFSLLEICISFSVIMSIIV